ncbi:hypothetical protein Tco_0696242 [Tanacetum coccineum]
MITYLTRKISRRFTTLYYTLPPNNTLSGLKQIKNDYDTNVMYDIASVAGKIQLFVSHHQIDLSTVFIPNDGSLEEAFAVYGRRKKNRKKMKRKGEKKEGKKRKGKKRDGKEKKNGKEEEEEIKGKRGRRSADVARGPAVILLLLCDCGDDYRLPTHHISNRLLGLLPLNSRQRHQETQCFKPNFGGRKAGRLHTRQETRNLGLKKITDDKGPVPIWFEWDDKKTLMPLGDHASHWSNYLGELIREMPLYYPSWQKTQFDLTPHMQSQRWTDINAGIQQHLQKLYNTNKASLKATHWIAFWNDPSNQARAVQNSQNQTKSTVVCRQGSRSLARLRDQMMESSVTREYPSLIHTFFVTHTVNGVFTRDEDRAIYEEMLRLQALGSNTPSGVPYTEEEINALARKGKQRGHLPGVGRVLPGRATDVLIPPPSPPPQCTHNSGDVEKLKKKNKYLTKQVNLMMKLFRSDDKFSQMLNQYESTPEFGSGSGGCGDDEMADDEDGGEDEEDEEDGDS